MLKINGLSKAYPILYGAPNIVLSNISLDIKDGDFISIIGSNGTGKSTFLNIISGLVKESSGEITLDDINLTALPEHKRTKFISRVFQNPSAGACPSMTVRENLSLALNKGKLLNLKRCLCYKAEKLEEILACISLDLKKSLDIKVKYLSGGQRQALALVMANISNPKILLLDEHTAALDPKTSNEIMNLTNDIVKDKNITTLMVTHNLKHALTYGNRLIMLHKGEILLDVSGSEKQKLTIENILERFDYAI